MSTRKNTAIRGVQGLDKHYGHHKGPIMAFNLSPAPTLGTVRTWKIWEGKSEQEFDDAWERTWDVFRSLMGWQPEGDRSTSDSEAAYWGGLIDTGGYEAMRRQFAWAVSLCRKMAREQVALTFDNGVRSYRV